MRLWRPTIRLWRPAIHLACAAILLAAGGCGGEAGTRAPEERPLVIGYSSELQTLNPVVSTDQNANDLIYHLLFTPIVRYDSTYDVRPGLAASWELTEEQVTFRLREDVRWHDGEPVTAADVKFTFDLAKDPAVASPLAAAYLANVAAAEVLGPYSIRFTFAAPHAQALEDFFWPPVPQHILQGVPAEDIARHPFGREPVGSGPYRFVGWDVNQRLTFEANADFAPSLGGPPNIDRVIYRIVPEATTLLRELLTGGLHVDGPLTPADAPQVEAADGVRLVAFPWRQFSYIGWNHRREPFGDPDIRRALTMAIDREAILAAVLQGYGRLATGPIPPWHRYASDLEPLPFVPDSAAAILERHGWRDRDGDGVREKDGRTFRFVLMANQRNPVWGDMVQIVQAQLAEIGVAVEPRLLEWQTVLGMHRARNFDAVVTNWVLDNFRMDPRILFHSSQVAIEGSANRSSYSNPALDRLMERGTRTMDEERAAEIWEEFSRILQEDQPFTFLFWHDELAGVSERLENVRMDARGELVTVPRWRWRDAAGGARVAGETDR